MTKYSVVKLHFDAVMYIIGFFSFLFHLLFLCLIPQGQSDSLGISVAGGVGCPHGNVPLFIDALHTNGMAAKTKQLQVINDMECVCMCV